MHRAAASVDQGNGGPRSSACELLIIASAAALVWSSAWPTSPALAQPQPPPALPAQGPDSGPSPQPVRPVSPAPRPAAAKPPVVPVSSGTSACIAGDARSSTPDDVYTAASLVCEALVAKGAKVDARPIDEAGASGHSSAYRVELRPLGSSVILQVGYESPIGRRIDGRTLQLSGIEEVTVAAPRLADSLVRGTPMGDTAKVDNLVGQETRTYSKEYGEVLFGIGLLGFALPGDTWSGYGMYGRLHYEAARYAFGLDLRLGGSSDGAGDAALGGISLGGRYFFSEANVTPFAGGGAGILWLGVYREYDDGVAGGERELDGSGLAGFGEVGIEFMRLHSSRVDILVRVDAPLFDLEGDGRDHYVLPVSLMASFSFD
jgi:hypothetical protein